MTTPFNRPLVLDSTLPAYHPLPPSNGTYTVAKSLWQER